MEVLLHTLNPGIADVPSIQKAKQIEESQDRHEMPIHLAQKPLLADGIPFCLLSLPRVATCGAWYVKAQGLLFHCHEQTLCLHGKRDGHEESSGPQVIQAFERETPSGQRGCLLDEVQRSSSVTQGLLRNAGGAGGCQNLYLLAISTVPSSSKTWNSSKWLDYWR